MLNLENGLIAVMQSRRERSINALLAACSVHEEEPRGCHHDGRTYPSVNQMEAEIDPCHNAAGRNDVPIIYDQLVRVDANIGEPLGQVRCVNPVGRG